MQIKWNRHIVVLYDKKQSELSVSLKNFIKDNFCPCDVISIDSDGYLPAFSRKARAGLDNFCVRHARWAIKTASEKQAKREQARIDEESKARPATTLSKIEKRDKRAVRVCNIIKRFKPEAIICTEPHALELAILARKQMRAKLRIIAEVADFVLDPRFVRFETDNFLVENEEMAMALKKDGIPVEKILVTGLPSRPSKEVDVRETRKSLGIENDRPVVVVNGGVYATDTMREDVIQLMKLTRDVSFNLLIVTAGQYRVRRYYMDLPDFSGGTILFYEEDDIDKVMAISDILVSVPSPSIIFSAFKYGVPVIATKGLTRHENTARSFLVKRALVMPSQTPEETVTAVKELLFDPLRREKFSIAGLSYSGLSMDDAGHSRGRLKQLNEVMRLSAPQKNNSINDNNDIEA